MTRTSTSHPLQIGSVSPGVPHGRIGITFCPGKHQADASTGAWARDLAPDVAAIRDWGAAAVVTLLETHEIESLCVPSLGGAVQAQHMTWFHLPIRDVSVPDMRFEQQWRAQGEKLRDLLRSGFDVLVHCKGGLGRAGTVAARLLVELGVAPEKAIAQVRAARTGAIEIMAQEDHVRAARPLDEPQPATTPAAIRDRALGTLLGLAVGDALGTTLEFRSRDTYTPLTDIIGGGPFCLKPGEWTDDTAMTLALADSLLANPNLDPADLMGRFWSWRQEGAYSCTGKCFDIGATVSGALNRWQRSGNPVAGSTDPNSAGNGALMRLAPVALRWWDDPKMLSLIAVNQSAVTHSAPEALSASSAFAELLADAIAGKPRTTVLRPRSSDYAGTISSVMGGSWRGKLRDQIRSSGYVAHSLEASLWAVGRTTTFRDAVLLAANLGGDADTTAAITGQLAGALYGARGIPEEWLARLAWRNRIERVGDALLEAQRSLSTKEHPADGCRPDRVR